MISIHTPLPGSDLYRLAAKAAGVDFNPHSPPGERLDAERARIKAIDISIHTPLPGSDNDFVDKVSEAENFNPHSPPGERRSASVSR